MDSMQQHTIQIFMWAWYPESAKIHQKVSGGFWRIQDMSNIYTNNNNTMWTYIAHVSTNLVVLKAHYYPCS